MNFQDSGIIVAKSLQGESSFVLSILTAEHGLHKGLIRSSKTNRPYLEPGIIHKVTWQARLSEHLGTWSIDPYFNPFPFLMNNPTALLALNSACALVLATLPEREPCQNIFHAFIEFIHQIPHGNYELLTAYCYLECEIVKSIALPLQLNRCAVTGNDQDLVYVSPKSGKAVSKEAAYGYENKLLALPYFLKHPSLKHTPSQQEIMDALKLSEYFIKKFVLDIHDKEMPHSRQRLKDAIQHLE